LLKTGKNERNLKEIQKGAGYCGNLRNRFVNLTKFEKFRKKKK
jgi:hypothetical protein